jgi:GTPase SAR1 family protein
VTKSVYIIGSAGAGKSTFTQQLLDNLGAKLGPLEDLHSLRNAKALVTLRGHRWPGGIYLGCMRDEYPGTDGLDRASSPVGAQWLNEGDVPDVLVAEGATLATRPFLTALAQDTDLMLVHLVVEEFVRELRFMERGSSQDERFVQNTVTRSANLFRDIDCQKIEVDTSYPEHWDNGLRICLEWLGL